MPTDIKPMLATLVDKPFDDPEWFYEVKWDEYRAISYVNNESVDIRSRNNKPFSENFYPIYDALKELPTDVILDGEIIVIDNNGTADLKFTNTDIIKLSEPLMQKAQTFLNSLKELD